MLTGFKAFGTGNPSGAVRLTTEDTDGDGTAEIITGHDAGGNSWVNVYDGNGVLVTGFKAFGSGNPSGAVRLSTGMEY